MPVIIWKYIEGFTGYKISNRGSVMNVRTKRILKPYINNGYYTVRLNKNKDEFVKSVHRLVAKTFIKNPNNLPVVDHINNDRLNNRLENLRWVTQRDNSKFYQDNYRSKRVILQYDKKNNFIRKWNCVNEIITTNPEYKKRLFITF